MSSTKGQSRVAAPTAGRPLIHLENATFRLGDAAVFAHTHWCWNPGEQWAILGPNGAGKSLFIQAIQCRLPRVRGELGYGFAPATGDRRTDGNDLAPEAAIVEVSPQTQRELARQESSFYQSRWHSGVAEGQRTVAQFLSQDAVERILDCEINAPRSNARSFARTRRQALRWLGLEGLVRRKLVYLSNGEQRKVLLARALLETPRILVLDDPYGGLDAATRERLRRVIQRSMRAGCRVLVATHRIEEIPRDTTHVLLVRGNRIVAKGLKEKVLDMALTRRLCGNPDRHAPSAPVAPPRLAPSAQRTAPARPVIELEDVCVEARGKKILDRVSWTVLEGERWALFGPNGAGKTTLLSLIQGDHPQVYAQKIRLFGASPATTQSLWKTRLRIGWMSPELTLHYPSEWPCLDVVCSGFYNSIGLYHGCSAGRRATARHWLRRMGLGPVEQEAFGAISTGVQRMVLLCRAAVKRPRLLVLDEPCQGVDAGRRRAILEAVDRLVEETGATLLFVSHHRDELPRCITKVIELRRGKVTRKG